MSWRSSLASWLDDSPRYSDRTEIVPVQNADLPATTLEGLKDNEAWSGFFNHVIPGLPAVTEKSAMTISAAYACVNLISGAISSMTGNLFRRDIKTGQREQIVNDDLWWVLNEEFLPRWSAANGWEYLCQSLLFQGDGFARIVRRGPAIVGLEPLNPLRVEVIPTRDRMRLVYAIVPEDGQGLEVYDQDDILHVPGFGFDGIRGASPLKYHLRMAGAVALATQEYSARFFANSARPDVVITSEQSINAEKANELRDRWEEIYRGVTNSHRPAILGHGAKIEPLNLSADDAQLLATRQFQIEEIARAYGVPPWMIGHVQKTTSFGAGVETMGTAFVRFTLRQHLSKFEKEINRKLFRTKAKFFEFDTFELERADMKALFEAFSKALGSPGAPGFMTPDEVRAKLNLPPKGGEADKLSTGQQPQPEENEAGEEEDDDAKEPTAQPPEE